MTANICELAVLAGLGSVKVPWMNASNLLVRKVTVVVVKSMMFDRCRDLQERRRSVPASAFGLSCSRTKVNSP
jgi:hypothetical protein